MLSFSTFLKEETAEDYRQSIIRMGYRNLKNISSKRFKILVPAKDRMKVADKIASRLGGALVTKGNDAGKPVVEFVGGIFLYVKPEPGSGVGGTAKEDAQLASLQKQIQDELSKTDLMELKIKIGNKYYAVAGAATTPGTPKSDFHLLNNKGIEVVWISHKDGSKAKDFQQWGGMSARAEPEIAKHKETQKFINDVKKEFGGVMPRATTVARPVKDKNLMGMSVYGNKYKSGVLGRQNVTILLQGPVKLVKSKNYYELESNHTSINGDIMTGDYAPVFMAIYKGDRNNFGVKGARFAIQPKASRKFKDI
jgi:hypothetical protein